MKIFIYQAIRFGNVTVLHHNVTGASASVKAEIKETKSKIYFFE